MAGSDDAGVDEEAGAEFRRQKTAPKRIRSGETGDRGRNVGVLE